MENYKKFAETVALLKKDMSEISKVDTLKELTDLESRCVNELQLIIVQAELCGRDLKEAIVKREREIRNA